MRPDGTNVIKILDFGISKQRTARAQEKKLTGQAVLGSPAYIAPEQLRSAKSVDARADVWSLGIVMYELLMGVVPFDGDGVGEVFAAVLEKETPEPMRAKRPDVPPGLEAVVMKCLQKAPEDRFQNASELAQAVMPFGTGKWNYLAEGIEQTLKRSTHRRTIESAEDKLLIEHAEAAAVRSRPPAALMNDEPPPATRMCLHPRRRRGDDARRGALAPRHPARTTTTGGSRVFAAVGAGVIVAVLAVAALVARGVLRTGPIASLTTLSEAHASSSSPATEGPAPATPATAPSALGAPPTAPGTEPSDVLEMESLDAPDAGPERTSSPAWRPPSHAVPDRRNPKPLTRPKFLNSRE